MKLKRLFDIRMLYLLFILGSIVYTLGTVISDLRYVDKYTSIQEIELEMKKDELDQTILIDVEGKSHNSLGNAIKQYDSPITVILKYTMTDLK